MLAAMSLPGAALADKFAAYARARAASARGDTATAAAQYGLVFAASPSDATVAARTFRQALAAGDLPLARRAALVIGGTSDVPVQAEAAVLGVADAIRAGDRPALNRAWNVLAKGPLDFLVPVIAAWASLGTARDPAAALAMTKETGAMARVIRENHALLLIAEARFDDAIPDLKSLLDDSSGELDLRYSAAELLAGQGRRDLAIRLVAGNDSRIAGFRAAIPVATPSSAFGVSRLFTRIADDLDDDRTATMAVALTRAALVLDPSDDRARVVLAGALGRLKSFDRALAVIAEIGGASAFRTPADEARIVLLHATGDEAGALAAAKRLAEAADAGPVAAQTYGDLLSDADRPRDAAAAYSLARDRMGSDDDWGVWVQIATSYDRAGDWRQARAAFERALKLGPDQGAVLNAFGEALLARNEGVPRAIAMLARANTLTPGQPGVAGALAWGYYRRGDVAKAVPLLEAASLAAPSNPVIAERLGDAYWSAGRRYEARYAWRAALAVAAPAAAPRIEAKLRDGLPAA